MPVTKAAVRRCLLVATTMTKGVSVSAVTGDMVEGWLGQAERHRMDDDELKEAFALACDRSTFFPAWHEILDAWRTIASQRSCLISDPVIVDGDRIGSEALCKKAGVEYAPLNGGPPYDLSDLERLKMRNEIKSLMSPGARDILESIDGKQAEERGLEEEPGHPSREQDGGFVERRRTSDAHVARSEVPPDRA